MSFVPDRNTPRRDGLQFVDPVAAADLILAGSMVLLDASGFAQSAIGGDPALKVRGVAQERADNTTGANGDISVWTRRGAVWQFENSTAADLITRADIGNPCYVVNFQTVAKTSATNTRPIAGTVRDVDDAGVWVEI